MVRALELLRPRLPWLDRVEVELRPRPWWSRLRVWMRERPEPAVHVRLIVRRGVGIDEEESLFDNGARFLALCKLVRATLHEAGHVSIVRVELVGDLHGRMWMWL